MWLVLIIDINDIIVIDIGEVVIVICEVIDVIVIGCFGWIFFLMVILEIIGNMV